MSDTEVEVEATPERVEVRARWRLETVARYVEAYGPALSGEDKIALVLEPAEGADRLPWTRNTTVMRPELLARVDLFAEHEVCIERLIQYPTGQVQRVIGEAPVMLAPEPRPDLHIDSRFFDAAASAAVVLRPLRDPVSATTAPFNVKVPPGPKLVKGRGPGAGSLRAMRRNMRRGR